MSSLTPPKLGGGGFDDKPNSATRVNRAENPPTRIPSVHPSTTPPRKDQAPKQTIGGAPRAVKTRGMHSKLPIEETQMVTKKISKKMPVPPPLREHQPRQSNIRRTRKGQGDPEPTQRRGPSPPRPIASPHHQQIPDSRAQTEDSSVGIDFKRQSWLSDNSSDQGALLRDYVDKETRDLCRALNNLSPRTRSKVAQEVRGVNSAPILIEDDAPSENDAWVAPPVSVRPRFGICKSEMYSHEDSSKPPSFVVQSVTALSQSPAKTEVGREPPALEISEAALANANPLATLDIWRGGKPPRNRRPSEGVDCRIKSTSEIKTQKLLAGLPPSERECVSFILALKPLVAPRANFLDYLTRVDCAKVRPLLALKSVFESSSHPVENEPPRRRSSTAERSAWVLPQALLGRLITVAQSANIFNWARAPDAFGLMDTVNGFAKYCHAIDVEFTAHGRHETIAKFHKQDKLVRTQLWSKMLQEFHEKLPRYLDRLMVERFEHLMIQRLTDVSTDFTCRAAAITYASLKDALDRPEYHSEPGPDITDSLSEMYSLQHQTVALRQQTEHILNSDHASLVDPFVDHLCADVGQENEPTAKIMIPNPLEELYERFLTEKYVSRLSHTRQKWQAHAKAFKDEVDVNLVAAKEAEACQRRRGPLGVTGSIDLYELLPQRMVECLKRDHPEYNSIIKIGNGTDLRTSIRRLSAVKEDGSRGSSTPASGYWQRRGSVSRRISNVDLDFSVNRLMAMPFTPVTVNDDILTRRRNSLTVGCAKLLATDRDTPVPSRRLVNS